jgi:hypothetical protein
MNFSRFLSKTIVIILIIIFLINQYFIIPQFELQFWGENVVITYRPDYRDYRRKNRNQVRKKIMRHKTMSRFKVSIF